MPDLWSDLKLAFTIIAFLYLVSWSTDFLDNKPLGVILAAVIAYLTFFSHYEILILVVVFFFGYPIFEAFAEGLGGSD